MFESIEFNFWPDGAVLVVTAFCASIFAAIAGTGGGVVLLPVMTSLLGVRDAIPAYALTQFFGNLARIWINRSEIDYQVVRWLSLGAVPMSIVGGMLFVHANDSILQRLLGAFLVTSVIWRRLVAKGELTHAPKNFVVLGGVFAFISSVVGSAGPFMAPFFLTYGLVHGAFIGTEALGTAIIHVVKLATYMAGGALSYAAILVGVALCPVMIAGSLIGKSIVDRISLTIFTTIIDLMLLVFGFVFLLR